MKTKLEAQWGADGGVCRAEFTGTCIFLTAPSSHIPLNFSLLLMWHLSQATLWDLYVFTYTLIGFDHVSP